MGPSDPTPRATRATPPTGIAPGSGTRQGGVRRQRPVAGEPTAGQDHLQPMAHSEGHGLSRSGTGGAASRRSVPVTSATPTCPRPWRAAQASGLACLFRPARPRPRRPIGRQGAIPGPAAVAGDLPRHGRRRRTQHSSNRPQRQPGGLAARDLLPLIQRQAQLSPPPRHRPDPARSLQQIPHRRWAHTHLPGQPPPAESRVPRSAVRAIWRTRGAGGNGRAPDPPPRPLRARPRIEDLSPRSPIAAQCNSAGPGV
jgi:hypothetical protein